MPPSCSFLRSVALTLLFPVLTAAVRADANYPTSYNFTTLAGDSSMGVVDGAAAAARFYRPGAVAIDSAGTVFVADTENHTIRKISPAGTVSTFSGKPATFGAADGAGNDARFCFPSGITVDQAGNLYVADGFNHAIRKITPTGDVTTFAGAAGEPGSADGAGASARFNFPNGIAIDRSGNLFVADSNNSTIRKITPAGQVTTLAGSAGIAGNRDGTGGAALFSDPLGLAVDQAGNLYVASSVGTIRKVTPAGLVSTLAGSVDVAGSLDGPGSAALFNYPSGLSVDSTGNLYVADTENNIIRKITPDGVVSTFAGTASPFPGGSADGSGSTAGFFKPTGLAFDPAGNLYVADSWNNTIRKITADGDVSTVAGLSRFASTGNTDGTGSTARFSDHTWVTAPGGVTVDPNGNLYLADTGNHTIRKITAAGDVTTVAGTVSEHGGFADGTGSTALFSYPEGIAVDRSGTLFVADSANNTIRKITPPGVVTTLAGTAGLSGDTDGTGSDARFGFPGAMTIDQAGNLYVLDEDYPKMIVRKVTPSGVVTTIGPLAYYTAGIAIDAAGNLYVPLNRSIVKISPDGVHTTLAGDDNSQGSQDGNGASAHFTSPTAVATDGTGNVYVTDSYDLTIRRISPAGEVSTLAGQVGAAGRADGTGKDTRFINLVAITADAAGDVYVTDGSTIRKGKLAGPPVITAQPKSQTAAPDKSVQFSIAASGVPNPIYQWYVNGGPLSGATGNRLSIASVRSSDAGDYTVVATNDLAAVTSNKATLTVSSAPTPTPTPGGGGGAIEAWLAIALFGMTVGRVVAARRRAPRASRFLPFG